ncbi:hypothetical protein JAAARDRAFT_488308 [Jaapia argillacea MUCL 33604]|uniref:Uncharacterized protein n=1 Tax=Jaapia argillacea MUCL 33604 TaxID=933084 RepID=A0A067PBM0_9AGAM|nr:hypothetical protein JAAARDRAFT_488308 [Jaapia argillacea MUCL 33604]
MVSEHLTPNATNLPTFLTQPIHVPAPIFPPNNLSPGECRANAALIRDTRPPSVSTLHPLHLEASAIERR